MKNFSSADTPGKGRPGRRNMRFSIRRPPERKTHPVEPEDLPSEKIPDKKRQVSPPSDNMPPNQPHYGALDWITSSPNSSTESGVPKKTTMKGTEAPGCTLVL